MTREEEDIIYHAMRALSRCSKVFCDLVNASPDYRLRDAYKSGIYAPAIQLQVLLGSDTIKRCDKDWKEIQEETKRCLNDLGRGTA